ADVTLAPGQSSYRTEIAKIIAAKPDALVTEMDPQSAATFLSEYQQLAGHLPIILGTQRTSNSDWIQAVLGAIGQGSYVKYVKARKAGQRIQYVGAGGTLAFNRYHSAERAFSYDNYDPANKSMNPVLVIPGSALNS